MLNADDMTVKQIAKNIGRHYTTVYKFLGREKIPMLKDPNRLHTTDRNLYTRTYPAKLFNAIKQLEKESIKQLELIANMKAEYRHAVESKRTDTERIKYQNLGPSAMHLWHPKVTIVNR